MIRSRPFDFNALDEQKVEELDELDAAQRLAARRAGHCHALDCVAARTAQGKAIGHVQ